jgi:hypothetical protein
MGTMGDQRDALARNDDLRQALATLDHTFSGVPFVGPVDGCTYCYSPDDLTQLADDPAAAPDDLVHAFAEEEVGHWAEDQYGTLWRRLAPRIIGLLANDPTQDAGLLLRGLGVAHVRLQSWPAEQRDAVMRALAALLAVAVTDQRSPGQVVDLLGGLGHVHHDLTPWFRQIDALEGPAADAGAVRLVCHWAADLVWGEEPNFWWFPDDPTGPVRDWLCSPTVEARLTRFAAEHPRCKTAADALIGVQSLRQGESAWLYPGYGYDQMQTGGLRELNGFLRPL